MVRRSAGSKSIYGMSLWRLGSRRALLIQVASHRYVKLQVEIAGKRVELLRELVPGLRRLADCYNPSALNDAIELKAVGDAATRFGIKLLPVKAQEAADYDKAAAMTREWTTHAVYISSNPTNYANRSRIIALMAAIRMPATTLPPSSRLAV